MALIDWKCHCYPPCWAPAQPWKTHLFCHVLQMISTQKQLIENADAVQEKIAQVQREGRLFICLTGALSKQRLYVLIIICVGMFSISETCFCPSVNIKQFFGKWTMGQTTNQPSQLITWLLWNSVSGWGPFGPVLTCCFRLLPSGMDFHEDLSRLGEKEGLKGRKLSKAVESFTWNITVLKVPARSLTRAAQKT